VIVQGWWPSVTSAEDVRAAYSPNNRQIARYILVRVGDLTTTKSSFLVLCLGRGRPGRNEFRASPTSLSHLDARNRQGVRGFLPFFRAGQGDRYRRAGPYSREIRRILP
jgi:hypothetical protein